MIGSILKHSHLGKFVQLTLQEDYQEHHRALLATLSQKIEMRQILMQETLSEEFLGD
jgi:hypothetical protein